MWIARFKDCDCNKPNCDCNEQLQGPPTCVAEGINSIAAAISMGWSEGTWREITEEEVKKLQKVTLKERVIEAVVAIKHRLDDFARTRGTYLDAADAVTYTTDFDPVFKLEGLYIKTMRSMTWRTAYNIFKQVEAGTVPMSDTLQDFLNKLPELKWPNKEGTTQPNTD